jgi:ATP-dependent DNA helicase RecQ
MERFTTCTGQRLMAILNNNFGYTSFRYPQQEIIESILANKSCFAIMPTGAGKSLCFQLLSFVANKPILVLSPLISLMDDQVKEAKSKGINAVALHSSSYTSMENFDKYQLIFCSPEKFNTTHFIKKLMMCVLSLIVVDEAHCISRWGHEFRPAYQQIKTSLRQFPKVNILALTATASRYVQKDIITQLNLQKNCVQFKSSLYRKNLHISLKHIVDKETYLIENISKNQTSIVYTRSRSHAESLASLFTKSKILAKAYHAKLSDQVKKEVQSSWFNDDTRCIVATNAFGMGINKSTVRQVFHYNIPDSIEDYIQEIGRAGRDMKDATCELLYTNKELMRLKKYSNHTISSMWKKYDRYKIGSRVRMLGLISRDFCRYSYLLDYFGEELSHKCGTCDYCLSQKIKACPNQSYVL